MTGVDESEAMLRHVHPRVAAVHSRIEELRLGRRFDAEVTYRLDDRVWDAPAAHRLRAPGHPDRRGSPNGRMSGERKNVVPSFLERRADALG